MDDLILIQHFGIEEFGVANRLNGHEGRHGKVRVGGIGADAGQKVPVMALNRGQHARVIRDHRQKARRRRGAATSLVQKMLDIGADHGVRVT